MLFQVWILKFLSIAIDAAYCKDENYMILFPTGPVFEGENECFVGPIFKHQNSYYKQVPALKQQFQYVERVFQII